MGQSEMQQKRTHEKVPTFFICAVFREAKHCTASPANHKLDIFQRNKGQGRDSPNITQISEFADSNNSNPEGSSYVISQLLATGVSMCQTRCWQFRVYRYIFFLFQNFSQVIFGADPDNKCVYI